MSRIPSTTGSNSNSSSSGNRDLSQVDVNQFLDLMIAELQNQDPLNPMDNEAMLNQIGQIRQIASTNSLTDTLTQVSIGQNIATASGLIGKKVTALTDDGKNVEGTVDRVSVQELDDASKTRLVKIQIGDEKISLNNVREIVDAA